MGKTRPGISSTTTTKVLYQSIEEEFAAQNNTIFNSAGTAVLYDSPKFLSENQLDLERLRIVFFADAFLESNDDIFHQLGFNVRLSDHTERTAWVHYSGYKWIHVVHPGLNGERNAFVDAFDIAYLLRHGLYLVTSRSLPILIFQDSATILELLIDFGTRYHGHCLMIDIQAFRKAYTRQEVRKICILFIKGIVADGLTKLKPQNAIGAFFLTDSSGLDMVQ